MMEKIRCKAMLPDGNRIIFRPFCIAESEVIVDIYQRGHYRELKLVEGEVVVDVGAHIGSFTLQAARIVGEEGKVIAFEPHPQNFKVLKDNVALNGYSNVTALQMALSKNQGSARLFLSSGSIAHSILFPRSMKTVQVQKSTLDAVMTTLEVERMDAVKIDAEGSEVDVLLGGERTIKKFTPRIAVASYHLPDQVFTVSRILESWSYRVKTVFVQASHYRAMSDAVPIVYGFAKV
jgi:FkbM family methyltransferase